MQDSAPPARTLSVSVSGSQRVRVGDSTQWSVTVDRTGDPAVTDPVHVSFSTTGGPTIDPIDIDAAHSTGTATVAVPASAKHGRFGFVVTATTDGPNATSGASAYELLVAGAPGSLDSSFGTDGVYTFSQTSTVTGVVADGRRIYLGGAIGTAPSIVALEETGALVSTFGTAGIYTPMFAGTAASTADLVGNSTEGFFLAATLNGASHTQGTLFGATGAGVAIPGFGVSGALSLTLQTAARASLAPKITGVKDGSIMITGRPDAASTPAAVQLVQSDGTPSTKFGTAPFDTIDDCASQNPTYAPSCVATAIAASEKGSAYAHCTYRLDGSNVGGESFDGTTLVASNTTSLQVEHCTALRLVNGKTYVAGDQAYRAVIAQYSASESAADDTFQGRTSLSDPSLNLSKVVDFYPQPADGTFAVGILANPMPGEVSFAVCRLKPDGTLDTTFAAPTGCAYQNVTGLADVVRMAIDSDQRMIIVGNNGKMVAARFWQ